MGPQRVKTIEVGRFLCRKTGFLTLYAEALGLHIPDDQIAIALRFSRKQRI